MLFIIMFTQTVRRIRAGPSAIVFRLVPISLRIFGFGSTVGVGVSQVVFSLLVVS